MAIRITVDQQQEPADVFCDAIAQAVVIQQAVEFEFRGITMTVFATDHVETLTTEWERKRSNDALLRVADLEQKVVALSSDCEARQQKIDELTTNFDSLRQCYELAQRKWNDTWNRERPDLQKQQIAQLVTLCSNLTGRLDALEAREMNP